MDVRNKIARELCVNTLIHREFSNPYPAKLVIEKDIVRTENANRAKMIGKINVDFYEPYPKNPKIAKVFKEIGLADELGSGVRNMVKYTKIYSGGVPEFKEDDIFKTNVPLTTLKTTLKTTPKNNLLDINKTQIAIVNIMKEKPSVTRKEIAEKLSITIDGVKYNIKILKNSGVIEREGTSRKGRWKVKEN